MTATISEGDYVRFTRMITPAKKQRVRSSTGQNFDYETQPAMLIEHAGQGVVRKVAKNPKRFGDERLRTARVDTGGILKIVTAVIDDAVIIGTQTHMDLGCEAKPIAMSQYDVTGDGA